MRKILVFPFILLIGIAVYLLSARSSVVEPVSTEPDFSSLGVYGYRCGDGTEFTMSPSSDMKFIRLTPATSVERIPEVVLAKIESATGARYEGSGIVFHAHGEAVELGSVDFSTTCTPMQVPAEAPFNFGD